MTSYQWNPTADYIESANVTRLARAHGLAGIDELRARSSPTRRGTGTRRPPTWACGSARPTAGCWI